MQPEHPTRGATVETKEKVLIALDESTAEWLYERMGSHVISDDYSREVWTALRDALFGESDA